MITGNVAATLACVSPTRNGRPGVAQYWVGRGKGKGTPTQAHTRTVATESDVTVYMKSVRPNESLKKRFRICAPQISIIFEGNEMH